MEQRDAYARQVEQLAGVAQQRDAYAQKLQDLCLDVARLGAECEVLRHGNDSIREQISQLTQQLQAQTRSVTSEIEHLSAERLRRSGLDNGSAENRGRR